jgi:hypothetical protein
MNPKCRPLFFVAVLSVSIVSMSLRAELELPRGTREAADLAAAQAEARKEGKPVAILYTDKDSTCPLCNGAATTMIEEIERSTVLVYARTKEGLPDQVGEALSREGKYIPKLVVYDAELQEELGLVIYERVKEDPRNAFDDLKKALREYKKRTQS